MSEQGARDGRSTEVPICGAEIHRGPSRWRCILPGEHAGPHWTLFNCGDSKAWTGDDRPHGEPSPRRSRDE